MKAEVPYHPAGRDVERWLSQPDTTAIRVPALDGERALVDALRLLGNPVERYRYAMHGEARALDALMGDPAWLGQEYDPVSVLGQGVTWDALANWSPMVVEALMRRFSHVIFVAMGSRDWQSLCPIPGIRLVCIEDSEVDDIESRLNDAIEQPSDRVVFCLSAATSDAVLKLMTERTAIRDRVVGVVALGISVRTEWANTGFTHQGMEPELQRTIPFFSVVDVDPENPLEETWDAQRFWEPSVSEGGRRAIEAIDLGVLQIGTVPDLVLGRSLWTTLAFRLSQGG